MGARSSPHGRELTDRSRESTAAAPTTRVGPPGSLFFSRSETIWGGTAEIQRNIIGERALGYRRNPRRKGVAPLLAAPRFLILVNRLGARSTCALLSVMAS